MSASLLCAGRTTLQSEVHITYVANAGFLISSRSAKVLIDGCHSGGLDEYEFPRGANLRSIQTASGPFADVDVILASHLHVDHFDAASVAAHLQANETTVFVSGSEMVDRVERVLAESDRIDAAESAALRLRRAAYEMSPHRERVELGDISVELFRLDHGGYPRPRYRLQNLGHIIEIGGARLLHVGDADMSLQNFYSYALHRDPVDLAFIPFWYLKDPLGRKIVRDLIAPRQVVAMHIPPANWKKEVSEIREHFPDVIVFSETLEHTNLRGPEK